MKHIIWIFIALFLSSCIKTETTKNHKENKVRIFTSNKGYDTRPHSYWDTDQREPEGIEPDLIRAILEKLELEYEFVDKFNYKSIVDIRIFALIEDVADISMWGISITDKRKEQVLFSEPYYTDALGILVNEDSDIHSIGDLEGKIILTTRAMTCYEWAKQNLKSSKVISELNLDDPLLQPDEVLKLGLADAYILDHSFLNSILNTSDHSMRILPDRLREEPLGIAVSKKRPELKKMIDRALREMRATGELEKFTSRFEQ